MEHHTTSFAADLFTLPVVLTPRAWQEAVHIEGSHSATLICNRLGEVILTAYREARLQPERRHIRFGLYRLLPTGDCQDRHWLDLNLTRLETAPGIGYLCISLKDESPFI